MLLVYRLCVGTQKLLNGLRKMLPLETSIFN